MSHNCDDVMTTATDEVKRVMRAATLGYDPSAILREAFDKHIDRNATLISFDDFLAAVVNGPAASAQHNAKVVGALTETEFRNLAEITVHKTNIWGYGQKARRESERATARNNVLFGDVCARLGVDETKTNLVMDVDEAALYEYEQTSTEEMLRKAFGL